MTKGKARINSGDSLAPPQPRSLRLRKRERPSEDISKRDDVQATLHHQETEGNNPSVDGALLQPPLQESTMILTPQCQAVEQSSPPKQDSVSEEKHAATIDVMGKAFGWQEVSTDIYPINDSQLEGCRADHSNDANKSGWEEEEEGEEEKIAAEERNRTSPQTCPDQVQVFLPKSKVVDGSTSTTLEEQLSAKENSQCNLERNQEISQEELRNVCMADMKEVRKEGAVGLSAKKKRRMGMCGLTEKERSYFLQTRNRENRQNGQERIEKQICNKMADFEAQEEMISSPSVPSSASIPQSSITEQNEAEIQLQSRQCGGDDRAETEVPIAVIASDGTSAVCDPGCSKGKGLEAEGDIVPNPEQTGDIESHSSTGEEEGRQQEVEQHTADVVTKETQEQTEDVSALVHQSPAITFYSDPKPLIHTHQNQEAGDWDAIVADSLQINSVTRKTVEELTGDPGDGVGAEPGASSADVWSGGFNRNSVELCEAAVTPSGSERKDICDPDDDPGAGPSTLNAKHPQTSDTSDPFGSEYLDYVSDSQLNTITLAEELVIKREEGLDSPNCQEDATDLICGLIGELSSLNRKVMATHRELENLRRSTKSSRSSIR